MLGDMLVACDWRGAGVRIADETLFLIPRLEHGPVKIAK